jgi:hypothetical protein
MMNKEVTIKKVGSGWVVTVWTPPKTAEIGFRQSKEEIFTDHDEMIDFVKANT